MEVLHDNAKYVSFCIATCLSVLQSLHSILKLIANVKNILRNLFETVSRYMGMQSCLHAEN